MVQPDGKIIAGGGTDSGGTRSFLLVRFTASGQLDASFGVDGVVKTPIGASAGMSDITFQDDKILAVGRTYNGTEDAVALARYNMDGTLDDGGPLDSTPGDWFGTDGIVTTDFVGSDYCQAVAIDAEGRIVVAGNVWETGIRESFAVARYTPDGFVDTTFGNGGLVYNDKRPGSNRGRTSSQGGSGVFFGDRVDRLERRAPKRTPDPLRVATPKRADLNQARQTVPPSAGTRACLWGCASI